MTGIPTPWLVGWREWSEGGRDAHGNPASSWAPPAPLPVHSVGPRYQQEPGEPNRWVVVDGLTVYAPAGTVVGAHDRVVWPFDPDNPDVGELWEVNGPIADWTKGPFANPVAGVTFELEKVTG